MNRKGFSLLEVLSVCLGLALIMALLIPKYLEEIDQARRTIILSEARQVYIVAQSIATEEYAKNTSDEEVEFGLRGIAGSSALPPSQMISKRINELLKDYITLGKTPSETVSTASFEVEDGRVKSVNYGRFVGKKYYEVKLP